MEAAIGSEARLLDRESALPLWAQLLGALRERVAAGDFEDSFPSEMELVAQYGVSRNTVRTVLGRLRSDGVVVSGRGRRPRLNPVIRQPLGSFYSLYELVEAAGLKQRSLVRRLEECRHVVLGRKLGLRADAPLVVLERIRFAGDEPFASEQACFPAEVARPLLDADLSQASIYQVLADTAGVRLTDGEETLTASVPTAAQRRELAVPTGVALLVIERLGCRDGMPVEWRRTFVRADRFSVVSEFSVGNEPRSHSAIRSGRGDWSSGGTGSDGPVVGASG